MKKILALSVALGALAVAAPAAAQEAGPTSTQSTTFEIEGSTPAKCQINAETTTVSLESDLTNDQGRARGNIGDRIASGLNALGIKAWCTGNSNTVGLGRTALTLEGGTGAPVDGFNTAIIYDLLMTIDGAERLDGGNQEGSEDGLNSEANPQFTHFGPNGAGASVDFTDGFTASEATSSSTAGEAPRSEYSPSNARLIAGDYSGTVTLQITPGL